MEHSLSTPITAREAYEQGITVCICTFRRTEVIHAIQSVQRQTMPDRVPFSIMVIDNDETDQKRSQIEQLCSSSPVALRYVHVPSRNISLARNGALEHANTRWIAFLDDDETAQEMWLSALWQRTTAAEVVLGPVEAEYPAEAPAWSRRCDFHSTRAGADLANAYTGNVIIDRLWVNSRRIGFLPALGRTGGEDTVFFRHLAAAGARFAFAPDAFVHESVPAARLNMRWVLRRMFRAGQTHGMICKMFDSRKFSRLWGTASAKMMVCALATLVTLPGSDLSRQWLSRACFHAGALNFRFSSKLLEEYA